VTSISAKWPSSRSRGDYAGDLAGLTMIDVEFGSEAAAERVRPPGWFGREITDDPRYRNRRLARDGLL